MSLVVVSTGLNSPNRKRCVDSVRSQTIEHEHHYIEAGTQEPRLNSTENRYRIIHTLSPLDIVIEVDGDDWLPNDRVFERVLAMYESPAVWMTYGSFVHADGRPGFCAPYQPGESYRRSAWRASHLKTFRAGLYQRILRGDFDGPRGGFCEHARDLLTMLPMLEMAGPDHVRFCEEILYIYSLPTAFEWSADAAGLAYERECVAWVRARHEYARLEAL